MAKNEAKHGIYRLKFSNKYVGKKVDGGIQYRSSWEQRLFYYMDHNINVIEWSSETVIIPYLFSLDGKFHKYYPDVVCKIRTKTGIKTFMVEIKPERQTKPPIKPSNRALSYKHRYEQDMYTYIKNEDKWKFASEYCTKNGIEFLILTEKHIFGK